MQQAWKVLRATGKGMPREEFETIAKSLPLEREILDILLEPGVPAAQAVLLAEQTYIASNAQKVLQLRKQITKY